MQLDTDTGLILGSRPANQRRRYKVMPSLNGWAQTWYHPQESLVPRLCYLQYVINGYHRLAQSHHHDKTE